MSTWLLDASVLLAALDAEDAQHAAARQILSGEATLATLDLAYYEVGNVAARAWRDLAAAERLTGLVDVIASDGGLVRVDAELIADAARIADREGLTVYDASYVAAATRVGARLVSCDQRDLVSRGLALTPTAAESD